MKAEERRHNQQLRQRQRQAYRQRNISATYLEDLHQQQNDNEHESLTAIKNNVKRKKSTGYTTMIKATHFQLSV